MPPFLSYCLLTIEVGEVSPTPTPTPAMRLLDAIKEINPKCTSTVLPSCEEKKRKRGGREEGTYPQREQHTAVT